MEFDVRGVFYSSLLPQVFAVVKLAWDGIQSFPGESSWSSVSASCLAWMCANHASLSHFMWLIPPSVIFWFSAPSQLSMFAFYGDSCKARLASLIMPSPGRATKASLSKYLLCVFRSCEVFPQRYVYDVTPFVDDRQNDLEKWTHSLAAHGLEDIQRSRGEFLPEYNGV